MWMLIEGIDFNRKIKNTFDAWTHRMTFCYVFLAYFIPLIIVTLTIVFAVLNQEDFLDVYAEYET